MKLTKEQETEILKATNLELQELVRRLTVELDNKNRELEIESSLERIRSHAMSMRDSGDLSVAAGMVFSELKKLGIHPFRSGVGLLTEEPHKALLYAAMEGPDYDALVLVGPIDLSAHKCMALQYESCLKQENYFPVLKGKEFQSYFEAVAGQISIPSVAESQFRKTHYGYYLPFKEGYFYTWTETPYTETEISLLERFKAIIALTFRRYLDLQKAEAQVRAAQIEVAVEKVRAKALAMHRTEDLHAVVVTLKNELLGLRIPGVTAATIYLEQDDGSIRILDLSTAHEGDCEKFELKLDKVFRLEDTDPDLWVRRIWNGTENYFVVEADEADFVRVVDWLYTIDPAGAEIAENIIREKSIKKAWLPTVKLEKGRLNVDLLEPPVPEIEPILLKMGAGFDLAYKRFLDLQNAEAQAREAHIEVSLERVRSKSMAMHSSDELKDVITIVIEQFKHLGFDLDLANFNYLSTPKEWIMWLATPDYTYPELLRIPAFDHPLFNRPVETVMKGLNFMSDTLTHDEFRTAWQHFYNTSPSMNDHDSAERKEYIAGCTGFARSIVFMKQIALTISNFKGVPYTEEQNNILRRFANVFEQTYTRFLDLQKAEAQAREARIEAALEKVRSRALAMHRSEELQEVVTAVFDRLKDLDIETDAINLDVFNDDLKNAYLWTAVPGHNYSQEFLIPYNDTVVFRDIYEGLVAGKDLHSKVYNREEKDEFLAFIFDRTDFRHMPEERKTMLYATEASTVSVAYAKHIAIIAQRYREQLFSDEENRILIRFAKVFEQAYIRFLDLQKAEGLAQKAEEDLVKLKAEKKKTEEALTELKNTQSQLIQAEKMASLGELTAGIAHEIQNPLNFVNNFSEVTSELLEEMKEQLAPDSYREGNWQAAKEIADDVIQNLEKILHHGKRADSIVKGMLQHSRSSSGQKELTDINNLADEYLRLAFHGLRAKDKSFNADLKTDFDINAGKLEIIPQDIGRVLVNLLNNAFYAVNEKRKKGLKGYEPMITVSTKKTGDRIELSVKDNGNGIPKEALEKIFQPFFTTKPTGQGTGLGLSLSYDIINAHGGELRVKTNEGKGSEFIIQLPVN